MPFIKELKRQTKIIRQSILKLNTKSKSNGPKERSIYNFSPTKDESTIENLPIDCLERIFLHLTIGDVPKDDVTTSSINNTLFNCIRVNQQWSTLVIPLLWRQPFSIVYRDKQNSALIYTLILFLSYREKLVLLDQQLKLEPTSAQNRLLKFNYPQLIRLFDYDNFIKSVHRWVVRYPNTCTEFEKSKLLAQLLGNVILKENSLNGFKSFNYFRVKTYDNFNFISLYDLTSEHSFSCLNNLDKLEYKNPHRINESNLEEFFDFFKVITMNCNNLKNISLDFKKENTDDCMEIDHSVSKFLLTQKRLENLSINFCSPIIYNSIYKHAHSLNYLHVKGINDITFLLKIITSCKSLHTLELEQSCKKDDNFNFTSSDFTTNLPLSHSTQLQINHLYFNYDDKRSETLLMFILEMSNSNLNTLSTKLITPNIIQIISSYCTNITSLNISNDLPRAHFNSLLKLISILPLRQLYLEISYSHSHEYLSAEIPNLAFSLPQNLTNLYLKCEIIPGDLDILLNQSRSQIKSLWLYNVSNYYTDYLTILYKYSLERNNCLKDVRFGWSKPFHSPRRNRRLSSVYSVDEEFQKIITKQLKDAKQNVHKGKRREKRLSFDVEGSFVISEVKDCVFSFHEHVFERRLSDYKD